MPLTPDSKPTPLHRHILLSRPFARGASVYVIAHATLVGALATCCIAPYSHVFGLAVAAGLLGAGLSIMVGLPLMQRSAWRAESTWMSILNGSEIATTVVDHTTGSFETGECWRSMLGYDERTVPKTRAAVHALIHPADLPAVVADMQNHLDGKTECFSRDFRIRDGHGEMRWVQWRSKVIERDGKGNALRVVGMTLDVDKRHRAETLQTEINQFLLSTLSALPSEIAVLDSNGVVLLTNDPWKQFRGMPATLSERVGVGQNYLSALRHVVEADQPAATAIQRAIHALLRGEQGEPQIEYQVKSDGKLHTYQVRLMRFNLADGPRVTVVHRDITSLIEAERVARENEERWKFAIDGSGDAIWDWQADRPQVYRSARYFKMLGMSAEDFAEDFDPLMDLVHPDDTPLVTEKYAGLKRGDYDLCAFEHRLRHKNGSWRWIMARCTVMRRDADRRALRILGVHTDISELKHVEAQLRARENENRLLALVAEHTTNAVVIANAEGRLEWANRGFESMTGFSLAEARGRMPRELLQGNDTDHEILELLERKLAAAEPLRTKMLNNRKDGSPYWVAMEVQPIRSADGSLRHFVAVMEDVTEYERMEAERRLSQKLESVGQLAAGIAHEINTPIQFVGDSITFLEEAWAGLGPLVSSARTLVDAQQPGDAGAPPLQASDVQFLLSNFPVALERAQDGVRRVAGIVRAIKEFAYPDRGHYLEADVNHAVRNTIIVARNEYKYVGTASVECADLPPVRCRISAINQVLLNLIVNAAHALEDSRHTPATGRIDVKTRLEGDHVVVTVQDNGCGIPDHIGERIFDPFFTSKDVGRGSGQGLAIARAIVVEQHQGKIQVQSKVGQGSTFELWLPKDGPQHDEKAEVEPLARSA
jgi:PAS domain S-box-containing protein